MMENVYRIGLIGCGSIGRKRARALPASCTLIRAFDIQPTATMQLLSEFTTATISDSVDALIHDSEVDIVLVATTHSALSSTALQAIEGGKHVFVEKPGAKSVHELVPLAKAATQNGVIARVGFNHRFHPSILMAKEIVGSAQFGDVLWIRARYGHGGRIGYENEWRLNRDVSGGGELLDQGSHLIDLTQLFCGEVSLKYSHLSTSFWNTSVEDNAFIHLGTRSGGSAWLHASWTEWKNTFSYEICMRTAKIEINGLGGSYGQETLNLYEMLPEMGPPLSRTWSWDAHDNSWGLELHDFISGVEGGASTGATLDDAIRTLSVIEKAYV